MIDYLLYKRIYKYGILLLFFGIHSITLAQEKKYTLAECLVYALQNSPALMVNTYDQKARSIEADRNKYKFLPEIDAYVRYHNYFSDMPTYIFPPAEGQVLSGGTVDGYYPVQLGLPNNLNTGFNITEVLFDREFFIPRSAVAVLDEYDALKLQEAREKVLYQVAIQYYQLAANQEKSKIIEYNLLRIEKLKSAIKLLVDEGFAKKTDYKRLLVKHSNLEAGKMQLAAGIKKQEDYIKLSMGMPDTVSLNLEYYDLDKESLVNDVDPVKGKSLQAKILEQEKDLLDLQRSRIKSENFPRLEAFANINFQAQRESFDFFSSGKDWYNISFWGVRLNIPILKGLDKKHRLAKSELSISKLEFGLQQNISRQKIEYINAKRDLQSSLMALEDRDINAGFALELFEEADLKYREGTILLSELLDAEATLREARMLYLTGLYAYEIAKLNFMKINGTLERLLE